MFLGSDYLPAVFSLLVVIKMFVLFFCETDPLLAVAILGFSFLSVATKTLPHQKNSPSVMNN